MAQPLFDPAALPIASVADGAPIDPELVSRASLRTFFASPKPWQPEIRAEQSIRMAEREPVSASVLMPIVMHATGLTMLLTQRTAHLHDHAGQVSFPGGRVEAGDSSESDTALRETEEEIGLSRSFVEIVGRLPEYVTGTGFKVAPIVGLVSTPFELTLDAFEVDEVFEVPLAFLMDPANYQKRSVQLEHSVRTFYTIPYRRHFIWGATAAMLRNLYCFLSAQTEAAAGKE